MKTVNDLFRLALSNIGAYGAGQQASAEDMQVCANVFPSMVEELSASEILYVSYDPTHLDEPCIDEANFLALAQLLANEIAPMFGLPMDMAGREAVMRRIRFTNKTSGYGFVTQAEYY